MHTTTLRSDAFQITVAGRPATIADVFPGFDAQDRLGIVVTRSFGAAGAGSLILAAVTAFYDCLRATGEDFFAYADYFAPTGEAARPDVLVRGSARSDAYIDAMLGGRGMALHEAQSFRRLDLDEALGLLPAAPG